MSEYVPAATRRVNGCCEYCLIHEDDVLLPHEPDHIIATKHRGTTTGTRDLNETMEFADENNRGAISFDIDRVKAASATTVESTR